MSTLKTARSMWSKPWRSAMARDSCSWFRTLCCRSASSKVVPAIRADSWACSTRSRSASPSSTMTSFRKRWPPRVCGRVTPSQSGSASRASAPSIGGDAAPTGRRWGWSGFMRCDGQVPADGLPHHVDRRRQARPGLQTQRALLNQHLQPVDDRASPGVCCVEKWGSARAVDEVHHGRVCMYGVGGYRQFLEVAGRLFEPDGRAIHEQVRRSRVSDRSPPELGGERLRPRRRPVPDEHLHPGLHERVDDRPGAAAGAQDERGAPGPRGRRQRREEPGRVGVVGVDRARRRTSACWPPRSRSRVRSRSSRARAPPPCAGS